MTNSPMQRFAIVNIALFVRQTLISFVEIIQTDGHDPSKCFTCEKGTDVAPNSIWATCLHLAQQKVTNKEALSIRIVESTTNVEKTIN